MRPQKVNDANLIEGLMEVLQAKGYDGASLNEFAQVSNLKKASLYHRFPNGKKEIAMAVLNFIGEWTQKNFLDFLSDSSLSQEERLDHAISNIDSMYEGGEKICILRALSMESNFELFGAKINEIMTLWIDGFYNLGLAFGLNQKDARDKAEQTLILVQGSLVVSKGMSTVSPFQQALKSIRRMYIIA